jgi:cytidylate kinase
MNQFMQPRSIAIDGPAGAGKSTVAKKVADHLQLLYVDTGAMYRAVTWYMLQHQVLLTDISSVIDKMKDIQISLSIDHGQQRVFVNQEDVTDRIRTPEISSNVSQVAQIPEVRRKLVDQQRKMAEQQAVVMDGRDIGTYVLPNAAVKIFLTASLKERATRRMMELQAQGYSVTLAELELELAKRDQMDTERSFAPLQKADDAYALDTTGKTVEQVVNEIIEIYENTTIHGEGQASR